MSTPARDTISWLYGVQCADGLLAVNALNLKGQTSLIINPDCRSGVSGDMTSYVQIKTRLASNGQIEYDDAMTLLRDYGLFVHGELSIKIW